MHLKIDFRSKDTKSENQILLARLNNRMEVLEKKTPVDFNFSELHHEKSY